MTFAEIILPLSLPKTLTYRIPDTDAGRLKAGMRVAVPLGREKLYTGLVAEIHENAPTVYQARDIQQILDERPSVTEIQLAHWQWVADYYMCSPGEVYRSALPSALLLESETSITLHPDFTNAELQDDEYLIVEALKQQSVLKIHDIVSILGKKTVFPVLRRLMAGGIVKLQEEISESYKPKLVRYVRLFPEFENQSGLQELLDILKNAEKQKDAILAYFQLRAQSRKPVSATQLAQTADVTQAALKALADKGIFEFYQLQHDRVQFGDEDEEMPVLSKPQQQAIDDIRAQFGDKDVVLLHGVTASGKTEVYIRLIEKFLESGKPVLYLVPEIALTTQLVGRLTRYFGNRVAVFHSKYSNNERVEVWGNVLDGSEKAQVVIGARSALFLPFQGLSLIVVDEEHEPLFKQQDPAPRYHARDAAIVLARLHGAKVLLGSATPAIESYHNAQSGKYGLATLNQRYAGVQLPEIELVDLKDKHFRKQMTGHFSDTLIGYITAALEQREQIILFQNRRGFAPVLECLTCGHVPQCTQCDVSLTFHKGKNQLRCHYCGFSIPKPTHCHRCHSVELTTKGFGTEQIELELQPLFPHARIGRMDQDTTRGKFGYEKIIDAFKRHETDILVGTQMLAKGLDFENVSLVGIMNADNMLYHPDFRAFERSFQMMAQVSGRSGRSKRGRVIIQTYNPMHNTIQQVTRHDYQGMFAEQLYERRNYRYPPFYKLIRLTVRNRDFERLRDSAQWLANVLLQNLNMPVLGPEAPPVARIRNQYIREILVKIPAEASLQGTKKTVRKILDSFGSVAQFRSVKVTVNVDVY
jgi:primosomal protein N' (replication factor Y)